MGTLEYWPGMWFERCHFVEYKCYTYIQYAQQLTLTVRLQLSSPCHDYWMSFAASITVQILPPPPPRLSLPAKLGKMPIRTSTLWLSNSVSSIFTKLDHKEKVKKRKKAKKSGIVWAQRSPISVRRGSHFLYKKADTSRGGGGGSEGSLNKYIVWELGEWVKFSGKIKKGGVIIPDDNITW